MHGLVLPPTCHHPTDKKRKATRWHFTPMPTDLPRRGTGYVPCCHGITEWSTTISSSPLRCISRASFFLSFSCVRSKRNQTRYATHYPVTELNVLPAVPLMAGNINFVAHVELPYGRVHPLIECQQQGVVDVSESFASVMHDDVINHARLFVACLDRHADLPGGPVLVRSELRLFEQGLPLDTPVLAALARTKEQGWRPFNHASVEAIAIHSPILLASSHQPGLPFASFPLSQTQLAALTPASDLELWPQQGRLLMRASLRGGGRKRSNFTPQISRRLQQLFTAGCH